jgi:hypothetical protein
LPRYDYVSMGFYTYDCLGWPFTQVPPGGGTVFIDELTLAERLRDAAVPGRARPGQGHSVKSLVVRALAAFFTGWERSGRALVPGAVSPSNVAVPAEDEPPIVLDMATTVAAYGKVKVKAQRGEQMPEGWMIDRQGQPLTDPKRADDGFLLPIGGYKGYGLALMFGLLAGTLNGAAMGRDVVDFNKDDVTPTNTGHAIVAISLAAFGDVPAFKQRVDELVRDLRASKRLPGVDAIRLPGEGSHAARAERTRLGIPLPPALMRHSARPMAAAPSMPHSRLTAPS